MKRRIPAGLALAAALSFLQPATAQQSVPQETMKKVYETVKTPYKYGLVLVPERDEDMVDSPTVFREKGKWYMTYVLFDSTGYETWLAESDDLLKWNTLGPILSFAGGSWDSAQRGGYLALQDYRWGGSYRAGKYDGRYWLSYIGGSSQGYEAGMLNVGMARTGGEIARPHEWEGFDAPVMTPADPDAGSWECYTLYKSSVIRAPKRLLGAPFVMYYNAKGSADGKESIGIALSDDLKTWRRYSDRPVLEHRRDHRRRADPEDGRPVRHVLLRRFLERKTVCGFQPFRLFVRSGPLDGLDGRRSDRSVRTLRQPFRTQIVRSEI